MVRRKKVRKLTGHQAVLIPFIIICLAITIQFANCEMDPQVPAKVKFYHFSSKVSYSELCHDGVESHLRTSKLKKDRPTFVIVDGFLSSVNTNMSQFVKNAVLKQRPGSNLIVVDWSELSGHNDINISEDSEFTDILIVYNSARTHVEFVGRRLAKFLGSLVVADKAVFSRMHLIGYSLGAHIAGLAGLNIFKKYNEKIPRITGLDPAGPGFSLKNREMRLDQTDAEFVDIYHTNRHTVGDTDNHVGHVDVYVNGGKIQPGCDSTGLFNATQCNHGFAWKVWNHCITAKCFACRCVSPECKTDEGSCAETETNRTLVGMNISMDLSGDFYLKTGILP